jgi:polyhydroxyalkanoate synthesis regulator phasin
MRDAIKRYLDTALSLTEIPRERAERIARRLASNGVIDRGQIRGVAADLVERSRENSRRITDLVTTEIRRQVSRLGLASKDDIERLRQRVQALEVSVRAQRKTSSVRGTARMPVKKKAAPVKKKATPVKKKATPGAKRKPARRA